MTTAIDKDRARSLMSNAIRKGELLRGRCEQENSGVCEGRIEGHHDDYSKPLDVRWLCFFHHRRFHKEHPAPRNREYRPSVRLAFTVPVELGEAVKAMAAAENRSVSNMVAVLLEAGLAA